MLLCCFSKSTLFGLHIWLPDARIGPGQRFRQQTMTGKKGVGGTKREGLGGGKEEAGARPSRNQAGRFGKGRTKKSTEWGRA